MNLLHDQLGREAFALRHPGQRHVGAAAAGLPRHSAFQAHQKHCVVLNLRLNAGGIGTSNPKPMNQTHTLKKREGPIDRRWPELALGLGTQPFNQFVGGQGLIRAEQRLNDGRTGRGQLPTPPLAKGPRPARTLRACVHGA